MAFNDRDAEKLEVLDGSRAGPNMRRAAVRIEDLQELLQLGQIQATEVSSAPTAAEFNKLLADVKELNKRLSVIATALQTRISR
ncbi:hypothetical protein PBC5_gp18 [Sinorhizobium phage PBC5]|uniref:hypothetical protein n=1 Tax=Sinorhizobium phage PBC5 TaxID=179237 RepID=UPI001BEAF9B5|nr:hypothetical protein PBC5_gp18 [Sinorhizobium phage PBC5]